MVRESLVFSMKNYSVLIIGSEIESLKAAYDLATIGHQVLLIEEEEELKASLEHKDTLPSGIMSWYAIHPLLMAVRNHPLIEIADLSVVDDILYSREGFSAIIKNKPCYIDTELCCFCGRCREVCPVEIPKLNKKAVDCISENGIPRSFFIDKRKKPPCEQACPLDINIQGYLALITEGKFTEALSLIRESAPLAGILGRICHRPCENRCRRGEVDEPIAVCSLKRFVADQEFVNPVPDQQNSKWEIKYPEKMAIIGSGPAGLTAAWELTRIGYKASIFEALPVAGGMLRTVIANYRLPESILDHEINILQSMGIEIIKNSPIGGNDGIESFFDQGFKAVLIATGADLNKKLGLSGEKLAGVFNCIPFLKRVNLGEKISVGKKVAVFGGGNAALESARTAVRLGAQEVTIIYRRTPEEMPGDKEELSLAIDEGVDVKYLVSPVRFTGFDGKLNGVICIHMILGETESDGRRLPIPQKGSEFTLEVDTAIVAIGQEPDLSFIEDKSPIQISQHSTIRVNPAYHTEQRGVFAAGDVVTGSATVSEAMGSAKKAALSIHRYIRGEPWEEMENLEEEKKDYEPIDPDIPCLSRPVMSSREVKERKKNFLEVAHGYRKDQAIKEAKRCLQCGICSECSQCLSACEDLGAINHSGIKKQDEYAFQIVMSFKPLDEIFISMLPEERIFYEQRGSETNLNQLLMLGAGMAGKAASFLTSKMQVFPPRPPMIEGLFEEDIRIGVFICSCNKTAGDPEILNEMEKFAAGFPEVIVSKILPSVCHPEGARVIADTIKSKGLTRVLVASCACCTLDMICTACNDQRLRCKGNLFNRLGLDPSIFEMINLKNFLLAKSKAEKETLIKGGKNFIESGLARVKLQQKLPGREEIIEKNVAIVGVTKESLTSAIALENMGYLIYLLDEKKFLPVDHREKDILGEINSGRIVYLPKYWIKSIEGHLGNFILGFHGSDQSPLKVSAILFSGIDLKNVPLKGNLQKKGFLHRSLPGFHSFSPWSTGIPGIFEMMIPETYPFAEQDLPGAAAAAQMAALLKKSEIRTKNVIAQVDKNRCRGCGQCMEICPFAAVEMMAGDFTEQETAHIIEMHCQGCGNCLSVCPTGAVDLLHKTENQIKKLIEMALR